MTSRSNSMRRARPLLGTLVDIRIDAEGASEIAIAAAFAEIAHCHARMSAHSAHSDLARIALATPGHAIRVDPRTWDVLFLAQRIAQASNGLFDVTVAPHLAAAGYLPAMPRKACSAHWWDLECLHEQRIRVRRPLALDLGGIAKGYAVDRAVDVLRAQGIVSGCVNAGGDLRVFGRDAEPVHVRHPGGPGTLIPLG